MSRISNLRGTLEEIFQIQKGGPQIKNNSGILEFKNSDDSAFVIARGLAPAGDNDFVTKIYAETLTKPVIVKRQADCSVALPDNTVVRGFVVVSTAGSGAAVGDVLYDNGLDDASVMEILAAVEGRTIAVTDALSGGTITFDPDSIYQWDTDGSVWVKIGDIGSVTGAVRTIRKVIDNSAAQDTTFLPPANCRILSASFEVTTPYSGGATVSVGKVGDLELLMAATDIDAQTADTYEIEQDTDFGASAVIRVTITGSPAAGAGVLLVKLANPLA